MQNTRHIYNNYKFNQKIVNVQDSALGESFASFIKHDHTANFTS